MACCDGATIAIQDGHQAMNTPFPLHPHLSLSSESDVMAASPRCVAPLGPHFRLSTDSLLPGGGSDLFSRLGTTTRCTVKYALRKGPQRRKSRLCRSTPVVLSPIGPAPFSSAAGE